MFRNEKGSTHNWVIGGMLVAFVVACIAIANCGKVNNFISPNQQVVEKASDKLASDPKVQEAVVEKASDKLHQDPVIRKKTVKKATKKLAKDPEVRKDAAVETAKVLQKDTEFRAETAKETAVTLQKDEEFREQAAEKTATVMQADQDFRKEAAQETAKASGRITSGGGTGSSEHYHHTGSIGAMAPAPTQVTFSNVAEEIGPCPDRTRACWAGVFPYRDGGDMVIPELPTGATLVDVEMYDDVRGIKPYFIGPKHRFPRLPGSGANFKWRDRNGDVHYQMITPQQKALLQARGLDVDSSHKGGSKYVMPIE